MPFHKYILCGHLRGLTGNALDHRSVPPGENNIIKRLPGVEIDAISS